MAGKPVQWISAICLLLGGVLSTQVYAVPRIDKDHIAVVINQRDPLSVRIGKYYAEKRGIPEKNLIKLSFSAARPTLTRQEWSGIQEGLNEKVDESVQAYALTWIKPYKVDCMSITTAFASGFDEGFCATGCKPTKHSPYYNSSTSAPRVAYGIRPAMIVADVTFEEAKALIDRGVRSDGSRPDGAAYLVETDDRARNTRAPSFPLIRNWLSSRLRISHIMADYIEHREDVLFYFTGRKHVPRIGTNRFVDGAIADHLTSTGGRLTGGRQMSILEWTRAGVTGTYGSVVEPCNFPEKFPNPAVVMKKYLGGEPLIAAYWKSVKWPGQGVFVGEPLASPYFGRNNE